MAKRRTQSDDYYADEEDNPIGLTSAFAPVKGPQSVDYDEGDDPVGLTGAFGPVPERDEPFGWDEEGKWNNFDWNAGYENTSDNQDAAPESDAVPREDEGKRGGADSPAGAAAAAATSAASAAPRTAGETRKSGRGRHAAPMPELSPRMKKSRRTRKVLIVLVILLVILIGVVGYLAYRTFTESQQESARQAQEKASAGAAEVIENVRGEGSRDSAIAQTEVPLLNGLFGMTSDEAVQAIGHGALVTSNREDTDPNTAIKTNLNVALTDEPADSKTSTPTVYLGLDKDGKVIEIGYSASASALGFGSLSFSDAVGTEHVVEKTFAKIGIDVPEGSVALPADKAQYTTYGKDGVSVERERCAFDGATNVNGLDCTWSAVLSYDYKTQIHTGNLDDTIRIIYVYVSENRAPDPEPAPAPAEPAPAAGQPA